MTHHRFDAVILDLDGVITRTAGLHARAWKRMLDEYLQRRNAEHHESHAPFDIREDYARYIDGKPRYDGVRSFLQSRGITLPDGNPGDPSDRETVCGLGNRKNEFFQEVVRTDGVEVFDDTVEQIRRWQREGKKLAVVSSSRNCAAILEAAGLTEPFAVKLDGVDAARLKLAGKPHPDIFLKAAELLGVEPSRAIVVEDAISGVQAGRAGRFALVVGVARKGDSEALRENGADVVLDDLRQLEQIERRIPPWAIDKQDELARRLEGKRLVVFLDYDGTLTPIVARPEDAILSDETRHELRELAKRTVVAVISGRDRADVAGLVQLDELYYAGSHGFDISGPGALRMEQDKGTTALPDLDAAERSLQARLAPISGARVERKRFAIAIHYRLVADEAVPQVEQAVDAVQAAHPHLRKRGGKKVFELQPDVEWDKGRAVLWLLEALGLATPDVLPIYVGDDLTDEDAFHALSDRGIGIIVGPPPGPTHAAWSLNNTDEVADYLRRLTRLLDERPEQRAVIGGIEDRG